MRRFNDEDPTGAEFPECDLSNARLVGVVMQVLAVRDRQASELEAWLAEVTPEQPVPDDDRCPTYVKGRRVRQCLGTVLNEEWEHHGFCVRDLEKLSRQGAP